MDFSTLCALRAPSRMAKFASEQDWVHLPTGPSLKLIDREISEFPRVSFPRIEREGTAHHPFMKVELERGPVVPKEPEFSVFEGVLKVT